MMGAMLSITGMFGMATYSISKRLRELGIRVALGAQRKQGIFPIGTKGLHLFNFTGTSQATPRTGLLTTASITGVHWDNGNHVYAVSNASGKLFVFTVTSTVVTQASGSPYAIPKPKG